MTRPASARALTLAAVALGLLTVAAAAWSVVPRGEVATPAQARLLRLTDALLAAQGADGVFDPYDPADARVPPILRTVPHALATAALARAVDLGLGAWRPDLSARLDAALDRLVERQQPGGTFGGMPPGRGDAWPSVNGAAAGVYAVALAARPADAPVLAAGLMALERMVSVGLRDGWTRALVALSLDAAAARGGNTLLGRDPRLGLAVTADDPEADASDAAVAEALVRRVLELPGTFPQAVAEAIVSLPPAFEGPRSDLQAWWLQAWVAVREAPDAGAFFGALGAALEDALRAPPAGRIAESWYADEVTLAAVTVLALAEGLAPVGRGPFPGLDSARNALAGP